jgi:hypothetical protein
VADPRAADRPAGGWPPDGRIVIGPLLGKTLSLFLSLFLCFFVSLFLCFFVSLFLCFFFSFFLSIFPAFLSSFNLLPFSFFLFRHRPKPSHLITYGRSFCPYVHPYVHPCPYVFKSVCTPPAPPMLLYRGTGRWRSIVMRWEDFGLLGPMPHLNPLITPSTEMGYREPMTINAFASILHFFGAHPGSPWGPFGPA